MASTVSDSQKLWEVSVPIRSERVSEVVSYLLKDTVINVFDYEILESGDMMVVFDSSDAAFEFKLRFA